MTPGVRFYTSLAGLLGAPALTIPVGFAEDLPVGIQLVGRPFGDAELLALGEAVQEQTDWHPGRRIAAEVSRETTDESAGRTVPAPRDSVE